MDAIILAAGMGKRLKNLTKDKTKCMITVNDITLIERMLSQLDELNLNKIILVVGYQSEKLINFIETLKINTPIEYIHNNIYDKTNNIYSLFLAKHYLEGSDCLILESDLIFEDGILEDLINDKRPNLALVDKFESWMDGTVVTIDDEDNIRNFYSKDQFSFEDIKNYYKTVNIYKFSSDFSKHYYIPFLEAYIKSLGFNEYYEQVLKVISNLKDANIKVKKINKKNWYEIDDIQDLNIAESIFAPKEKKLEKFTARYGGYWRYPNLIDFCYLVNPYYPPNSLISELKSNFEELLVNYPSGMDVNTLLVSKYFNIMQKNICVGNGASEIIKSLIEHVLDENSKLGVMIPTFEEYSNRMNPKNIITFDTSSNNYRYNADDIIQFFSQKEIDMLVLINPDNPSGNYLFKEDVEKLIKWTKDNGILFVVDESFIDFVDCESNATFLNQEIIDENKNFIVVKSISKSFGVPGLRLGILASGDEKLIEFIKNDLSIWNINSFGEFYLQIFEKYEFDYEMGLNKFKQARKKYVDELKTIDKLNVIPSQANYIMCEVTGDMNSYELTNILLNDYNLLIKDLSNKKGCEGKSYIRIAVRDEKDNEILVSALKEILN
ncbi:MAG: aminotransferase class I/II-fold pyridoxal phosphate-dependent enzyme [Methanobrevibacter sp.]|uniref:aminotransferase class I/II-fold pyridoxal phosphate-dependent enzyme n=1 Tax=Methanobrevibacter sp. TaxID=66852 RepID=UPI0025F99A5F|nr:aminotransferase class I/II-fold pyridoxal phosphate-dependent enzyme [Methanobrevibacter sp.]MBQ6098515.1 aminotransferase class I/II-fold pyridoxal phosphate-dependent enzyme [Methanobrevibacter sp.]